MLPRLCVFFPCLSRGVRETVACARFRVKLLHAAWIDLLRLKLVVFSPQAAVGSAVPGTNVA